MPRSAPGWLAAVVLCVWLVTFATLVRRPAIDLAEAHGLYASEGPAQPFRWTGSQVLFPVHGRSGPVQVALQLAGARWPERAPAHVTLATDVGALASFTAPDRPHSYHLLLPASTTMLLLRSTVAQPPSGEPRWLGVQVLGLEATAAGFAAQAVVLALLVVLASIPITLAVAWSIRRGHGAVAALTMLGLALRTLMLGRVPAGFFQDEAVSLVDAWHLARTGHDHLGHLLPLGALEAFGDWISPLFTYLAVPVVALFGPSLLAGRLLAAVAGALAIPAGYALARALKLPIAAAACAALVVAVSPWQILRSRAATPPALIPLCWTLCLLAALRLVQRGDRRDAIWLALAAGIGIYSYPTMKLAVPLLISLAALLAWLRHGRHAARGWLPAALLLALLWLPLTSVTLLNQDSAMRARSKLLQADSPAAWLRQWAGAYGSYFLPGFYYTTGDPSNGMPDRGVELLPEAPLVLLGLGALVWGCLPRKDRDEGAVVSHQSSIVSRHPTEARLMAGALLIAPLPASLMFPNPHLTRALLIAPGYALLVAVGVAALWQMARRIQQPGAQAIAGHGAVLLLAAAVAWQGGVQFQDYLRRFPAVISQKYQDGMFEAMQAAVQDAPGYDEIWIDDRMPFPYIFVLAAQPMPPAQAQAQIEVQHGHTTFNTITAIGRYQFRNLAALPGDLPVVEALPTGIGGPGFVLQEWRPDRRRVLLVRRMR
jgi:4-amino-4-deoxy-L-arabinose transferase-like glycosyltransferase